MELKNNLEHANWQMLAFVNRGVMEKQRDAITGEIVEKQQKPIYKLIHVPPLATVEIDDALWEAATFDTKRIRRLYTTKQVKIEGLKQGKKDLFKIERTYTGETESFCLIQEQVIAGDITIVVPPKSKLTVEQMQAKLKAAGVPTAKDASDETITTLYNKVCR